MMTLLLRLALTMCSLATACSSRRDSADRRSSVKPSMLVVAPVPRSLLACLLAK